MDAIRNLTNSSGQVIVGYSYDAFGALRSSSGSVTNDFRFTGEQLDGETGLYYLRARYYDPSTGRFIVRDPLRGMIGNPASQNPYVYAENNPVNLVDPSGEHGTGPAQEELFKRLVEQLVDILLSRIAASVSQGGSALCRTSTPETALADLESAVASGRPSIRVGSRNEAWELAQKWLGGPQDIRAVRDRNTGKLTGWLNLRTGRMIRNPEYDNRFGWHVNARQLEWDSTRDKWGRVISNVHIQFFE